jgi:hypothetical protein
MTCDFGFSAAAGEIVRLKRAAWHLGCPGVAGDLMDATGGRI